MQGFKDKTTAQIDKDGIRYIESSEVDALVEKAREEGRPVKRLNLKKIKELVKQSKKTFFWEL